MAASTKIPFLITIDTEGDNLWERPKVITTENAKGLDRFQNLCDKFGFKPTYLTNYEMAQDAHFIKFAKRAIREKRCEVGMHLHAWNSPPLNSLTEDDYKYQPYLIDYPEELMYQKINYLDNQLQNTFETKMASHRAGRWAMNETYMNLLEKQGYKVDCSVTPGISWASSTGVPYGMGGSDYSEFPDGPYYPSYTEISKKGDMKILELPVTIAKNHNPMYALINDVAQFIGKTKIINMLNTRQYLWIRPRKNNLKQMIITAQSKLGEEGIKYIQFMLHSSELTAGTNPQFKNLNDIDKLYNDLDALFTFLASQCVGLTLDDYHSSYIATEKR